MAVMGRPQTPYLWKAFDDYMDSRYDLAEDTKINDRSAIGKMITGLRRDRRIGNVEPRQVEDWFRTTCAKANKEPSSFNKVRPFARRASSNGALSGGTCART